MSDVYKKYLIYGDEYGELEIFIDAGQIMFRVSDDTAESIFFTGCPAADLRELAMDIIDACEPETTVSGLSGKIERYANLI